MGQNLTNSPDLLPTRYAIDFNRMPLEQASLYTEPFLHIEKAVKPYRITHSNKKLREFWWQFEAPRPEMRKALEELDFCFAVPRVSKWNIFVLFQHKVMLPGEKTIIVASNDFYLFGILNSILHRQWIDAQKSTLKADTAYTNTTCFETFPFLWDAPEKLTQPVREIMTELENFRMGEMQARQWGITKLYS